MSPGDCLLGESHYSPNVLHEASNISHVITGGVGGMGILMATVLVKNGNKHLVLTSRRDHVPSESLEMFNQLSASGAQIVRRRVNSSSADGVKKIMADNTVHPPILGITHGAGVLRDSKIDAQTRGKYVDVLQPKYNGAWILHHLTANKPWDIRNFSMYSSLSAIVGSPGQSNHAAANAGMDQLSAFRSANGLISSTINLGAIAEIGYAARHSVGAGAPAKAKVMQSLEAASAIQAPAAEIGPPNQEGAEEAAELADAKPAELADAKPQEEGEEKVGEAATEAQEGEAEGQEEAEAQEAPMV